MDMKNKNADSTHKQGHAKHMKMMAICCIVPIIGLLAIAAIGISSPSLETLILLICPIAMVGMMYMMHRDSQGQDQGHACCKSAPAEEKLQHEDGVTQEMPPKERPTPSA